MYILGISAYYHDSAASLIQNGKIIAAAEEERFTRNKHDKSFPKNAIEFCLKYAEITLDEVEYIVFYDKPLLKFERLIESVLWSVPLGLNFFMSFATEWIGQGKFFLKKTLKKELSNFLKAEKKLTILFSEHHRSHAASAFFPSPYEEAAVLCLDGVGEWATTSCWIAKKNKIEQLWQIDFPHSIGLLYSAFTYYLGFEVNDSEYKIMGLAAYGKPIYAEIIKNFLIDIKDDGSFRLNTQYFDFIHGLKMTNSKFEKLFSQIRRSADSEITDFHKNIASSIQNILEEVVLKIAKNIKDETKIDNLCLAGGVALNCVANSKIVDQKIFKNIWIQPAAGDSGGSLGAALSVWFEFLNQPRLENNEYSMQGSLLGPHFSRDEIKNELDAVSAKYQEFYEEELLTKAIEDIEQQKVIGWFQGRMEFGPRALGSRSIIGDPRSSQMQNIINAKIKFRESFRPFAPAVLEEKYAEYFNIKMKSPYMLLTAPVKTEYLNKLPAVTHVDNSARIQTVNIKNNLIFYNLIKKFYEQTGCGILINTSFNIKGEPIVCTPFDAYNCFMNTDLDILIVGNFYLKKIDQSNYSKSLNKKLTNIITENVLQKFGLTMTLLIPFLLIVLIPIIKKINANYWSLALSLIILIVTLAKPTYLKIFYMAWMLFGRIMGLIKSKIFLILVYYVLLVPYGFLMRLFINGQLSEKIDFNKKSYKKKNEESYIQNIQRMKYPL